MFRQLRADGSIPMDGVRIKSYDDWLEFWNLETRKRKLSKEEAASALKELDEIFRAEFDGSWQKSRENTSLIERLSILADGR